MCCNWRKMKMTLSQFHLTKTTRKRGNSAIDFINTTVLKLSNESKWMVAPSCEVLRPIIMQPIPLTALIGLSTSGLPRCLLFNGVISMEILMIISSILPDNWATLLTHWCFVTTPWKICLSGPLKDTRCSPISLAWWWAFSKIYWEVLLKWLASTRILIKRLRKKTKPGFTLNWERFSGSW
jgi:hypothetical protein